MSLYDLRKLFTETKGLYLGTAHYKHHCLKHHTMTIPLMMMMMSSSSQPWQMFQQDLCKKKLTCVFKVPPILQSVLL